MIKQYGFFILLILASVFWSLVLKESFTDLFVLMGVAYLVLQSNSQHK